LRLTLDESVYELLMEHGYTPELGARPMERAIDSLIAQPLAKVILAEGLGQETEIVARAVRAGVVFDRR
jgi:ATP-dependent Clp protease ATP-binding subunit ClpA